MKTIEQIREDLAKLWANAEKQRKGDLLTDEQANNEKADILAKYLYAVELLGDAHDDDADNDADEE